MDPRRPLPLMALCLVVAFAAWLPALGIAPYSDDFQFFFDEPQRWLLRHFWAPNPANDFYRPIQASVQAAVQVIWGTWTLPLHVIHITLHAALGWVVIQALMGLGLPAAAATLGGIYVLVQQSGALAVASNDTLAQVLGTLAGTACLALLDRWLTRGGRAAWGGALLLLAVALFSKETSVGFCLLIAGVIAARQRWDDPRGALRGAVIQGLPFAAVALAYLAIRSGVVISHAELGEARYDFALGMNIPRNVAMLIGAALFPGATSTAFVAAKARDAATLAPLLASAAVGGMILTVGLARSARRGLVLAAGIGCLGATLPAALLNHVSEAYSYNVLPFLGMLVALAAEPWRSGALPRWMRLPAALIAAGLLALNVGAAWTKAGQMAECGRRAQQLLGEVATWAKEVPPGSTLLLISPEPAAPPYSIFLIPGYEVLRFGDDALRRRAGRPDLKMQLARAGSWQEAPCPAPCIPFGFEHNAVIPLGEEELEELGEPHP